MYLCIPTPHVSSTPLCIVTWKPGFLCMAVCVCHSHPTTGPTPWLKCVHTSVHVYMSTWLTMSASLFGIVIWTSGCPCVAMCVCVCVCVCYSQLACGPTPWLKCVHALVHVLMSTWAQNSDTLPLHSYMETWVPGCGTVCMFHFWSHILFRMCTGISACIYVHPTAHVSSTPYGLVTWEPGCICVAVCVCSSHPASGHTPCFRMCTCISTWIYVHLTANVYCTPMHSLMESWASLSGIVCLSQSPPFWPHTLVRMCTCINTWIYVMDCYGSACSYIHRMTHSSKNHPKFLPNFHLVITLIVHKRYVHLLDHCNLHSKSLFYFICHINFFLLNVLNELRSCGPVFFLYFHLQELQDSFYKSPFVHIYVSISPAHAQRFYCWHKSDIQFIFWNLTKWGQIMWT